MNEPETRGGSPRGSLLEAGRSVELALILAASRHQAADSRRAAVDALVEAAGVDWERLTLLSAAHGLIRVVERAIAGTNPARVPQSARTRLGEHALAAEWRQRILAAELLRLCEAFDRQGTPLLCFKGPALAHLVWEEAELRSCDDLDLLVPPERAVDAARLLEAVGYRRHYPSRHHRPRLERAHLETWNEYEYLSGDGLISVDLHWALAPYRYPFRFELDDAWSAPVRVSLGDGTVPTLSTESLLVALTIHGTKHLWARLLWICDVDRLVRATPNLDWDAALARSRRSRSERALLLGLVVCRDLLGTPLPDELGRRADALDSVGSLARRIPRFLETADLPASFLSEVAGLKLDLLGATDGRGDALRYVWRTLTIAGEPDWERLALPDALYGGYTVLRPLRLAARAARVGWRALAGSPQEGQQ